MAARGLSLVAVLGLLTAAASLVASTGSSRSGYSSCGSQVLEHRFDRCGAWAQPDTCGIFPVQGSNPLSPALAGRFLSPVPPWKSRTAVLEGTSYVVTLGGVAPRTTAVWNSQLSLPHGDSQAQLQPTLLSKHFSGNLMCEDPCSQLNKPGANIIVQGLHLVLCSHVCALHPYSLPKRQPVLKYAFPVNIHRFQLNTSGNRPPCVWCNLIIARKMSLECISSLLSRQI